MIIQEINEKIYESMREQEDFFIKFLSYEFKHKCGDDLYMCYEMDGELILSNNLSYVFSPGPTLRRKVKFCPFCGLKSE